MAAYIARGRCDLTAVLHPLGFLCIPAQRSGEHGICVHVWTPALQPTITTSQVHSHSWDLTSYVLYGTLFNQRIRVAEAGAAATHRIFEVRSRGDRDELHATTRLVSCEPEPTREYGAGIPCTTWRPGSSTQPLSLARRRWQPLLLAAAAPLPLTSAPSRCTPAVTRSPGHAAPYPRLPAPRSWWRDGLRHWASHDRPPRGHDAAQPPGGHSPRPDLARRVAVDAAEAAGAPVHAPAQQGTGMRVKDATGDVVSDLDLAAEQLIISRIRAAFPGHRIIAEESGRSTPSVPPGLTAAAHGLWIRSMAPTTWPSGCRFTLSESRSAWEPCRCSVWCTIQ